MHSIFLWINKYHFLATIRRSTGRTLTAELSNAWHLFSFRLHFSIQKFQQFENTLKSRRKGSLLKIVFLGFTAVLLTGCVTKMKNLKLLSMVSEPTAGSSLGVIDAKDCATNVLGIGRPVSTLSVEGALKRSVSEQGLKYMNNVKFEQETADYVVFNRTCFIVTGEGFK